MGVLKDKSLSFAVRIVKLYQFLSSDKNEYTLSKQLLRSGTAIGALQREAEHAESKLDFIHKYAIAQKECNESLYWLELLNKTCYLIEKQYNSLMLDAEELITASIKTVKKSLVKNATN